MLTHESMRFRREIESSVDHKSEESDGQDLTHVGLVTDVASLADSPEDKTISSTVGDRDSGSIVEPPYTNSIISQRSLHSSVSKSGAAVLQFNSNVPASRPAFGSDTNSSHHVQFKWSMCLVIVGID